MDKLRIARRLASNLEVLFTQAEDLEYADEWQELEQKIREIEQSLGDSPDEKDLAEVARLKNVVQNAERAKAESDVAEEFEKQREEDEYAYGRHIDQKIDEARGK